MDKYESLVNKRILLGITGSIAATKSLELAQQLLAQGAMVKFVCTESGLLFCDLEKIKELKIEIFTEIFSESTEQMDHISLAKWADVLLIAPASASILSRCATGLADQLLSLIYLATDAVTMIAPAMNQEMWAKKIVQDNVVALTQAGCIMLGPDYGEQACGDVGWGRMLNPEVIVRALADYCLQRAKGLNVLITAGPTLEDIGPVRYLSNYSSGKMGYALANAFTQQGATVTLISGPTSIKTPPVNTLVHVHSAQDMCDAVLNALNGNDIVIMAAAVADYRPVEVSQQKIKKTEEKMILDLVKNPDILETIRSVNEKIYTVGFALETQDLIKHATEKLRRKKLDMIIANQHTKQAPVFGADTNQVSVITKDESCLNLEKQSKQQLARKLVDIICQNYQARI